MNALQKEELRLLRLLESNQQAQLNDRPLYRRFMETKTLIGSRTEAPTDSKGEKPTE